jgi:hypothetical protein
VNREICAKKLQPLFETESACRRVSFRSTGKPQNIMDCDCG